MPRITHFDIVADDIERALKFYETVFGWKNQKWDGPTDYWLLTTGKEGEAGIDGGIARKSEAPTPHITNTIEIDSVDESIEKIKANGGEIIWPKKPIPGVGYMAAFKDPEGNLFGVMENDPSAK